MSVDITGKKFNRLLVIKIAKKGRRKSRELHWLCLCDCGKRLVVSSANVRRGNTVSCGCKRKEQLRTHGKSYWPEYKIWAGMINRCTNIKDSGYKWYGGKGVKVCKEWRNDFDRFIKDVGRRPTPKHSIDRINPFLNYDKNNCRWATAKQQANNQRRHWIKIKKLLGSE